MAAFIHKPALLDENLPNLSVIPNPTFEWVVPPIKAGTIYCLAIYSLVKVLTLNKWDNEMLTAMTGARSFLSQNIFPKGYYNDLYLKMQNQNSQFSTISAGFA